jgi:hypothetical protein
VVARCTIGGTNKVTGKRGQTLVSVICRFAGGKVVEGWQLTAPVEA